MKLLNILFNPLNFLNMFTLYLGGGGGGGGGGGTGIVPLVGPRSVISISSTCP